MEMFLKDENVESWMSGDLTKYKIMNERIREKDAVVPNNY